MNEYDSNRIYDLTSKIGFDKTNEKQEADCIVLNTCHIREKATEKVYDEVGRIKKDFRKLKKPIVIVSGCVAQAESDEMIKREKYIDMVIGPQSYQKINDLILDFQRKNKKINETEFDVVEKFDKLEKIPNSGNKISSYLTIQEGCDKFCNFCVVPYTRGPEYSRPFKQIINEANELIINGAREITLLGQNVNAYNYSENGISYKLSSIIKELNKINDLKRIRFTTSHPKDMTADLINCFRECKKLVPFLHLPIQSGSDKILSLMNRKHDREYFLSIVDKIRNANQNVELSSDFLIGYPEETDKDFDQTIKLIEKVGFINSYSFIFSPRAGTPASQKKLNNQKVNEDRLKKLQKLLEKLQLESNKKYLQNKCEVLVENKLNNQDKFFGRVKSMTPVIFQSNNCEPGELVEVLITSFNQKNLFGFHKSENERAA